VVSERDLFTSYELTAQLVKEKYFSLTELDNMMPFEINVYVDLINAIKKKEQDQQQGNKRYL
jgi:hypothetical protein